MPRAAPALASDHTLLYTSALDSSHQPLLRCLGVDSSTTRTSVRHTRSIQAANTQHTRSIHAPQRGTLCAPLPFHTRPHFGSTKHNAPDPGWPLLSGLATPSLGENHTHGIIHQHMGDGARTHWVWQARATLHPPCSCSSGWVGRDAKLIKPCKRAWRRGRVLLRVNLRGPCPQKPFPALVRQRRALLRVNLRGPCPQKPWPALVRPCPCACEPVIRPPLKSCTLQKVPGLGTGPSTAHCPVCTATALLATSPPVNAWLQEHKQSKRIEQGGTGALDCMLKVLRCMVSCMPPVRLL